MMQLVFHSSILCWLNCEYTYSIAVKNGRLSSVKCLSKMDRAVKVFIF